MATHPCGRAIAISLLLFANIAHAGEPGFFGLACRHLLGRASGRIEAARPEMRGWSDKRFVKFWTGGDAARFKGNPERWFASGREDTAPPDKVMRGLKPRYARTVVPCSKDFLGQVERLLVRPTPPIEQGRDPNDVAHWLERQRLTCIFREGDLVRPVGLIQSWTEPPPADGPGSNVQFHLRQRTFVKQPTGSWALRADDRTGLWRLPWIFYLAPPMF